MAFILQNSSAGPEALGGYGGYFGYSGISPSAAIELNICSNGHTVGTGYYVNGQTAANGGSDYKSTSPVNLASGDPIQVSLVYDGANLTETLTDETTHATYSTTYSNVNLASQVGGGPAYLGFGGGTGGLASTQTISNFSFTVGNASSTNAWTTNGGAAISNNVLTLTNGVDYEARSAYYDTPVPVNGPFQATFTYQATGNGGLADGVAFILQNSSAGPEALGGYGGYFGYSGISPSAAIELNICSNGHTVGTGYYVNGQTGANGGSDYKSTSPVNLASGDPIQVSLVYDGDNLTETLTDETTHATYTTTYNNVNLASQVGGSTAYLGFGGGTGGLASTQTITNFSLVTSGVNFLPASTAVTIAAGGTLNLGDSSQTIASLADAPTGSTAGEQVILGGGTLTVGDNTSPTFSGVISGNGNLTKTGSGIWTLANTETFTGSTQIVAGQVNLPSIGSPPAVPDGGFEQPTLPQYSFQYAPSGSPWTYTYPAALATNGSAFMANNYPQSTNGNQTAVLQLTGTISQSIYFPSAGVYAVDFQSAARTYGNGGNPFNVCIDGTLAGSFLPTNTTAFANYQTNFFSLAAGNHVLSFVGLNSTGDYSSYVDNVSIVALGGGITGSPVSVQNGAVLQDGGGSIGAGLTLAAGSTLDMTSAGLGTVGVAGSGTALTLQGATLDFNLGGSGAEQLAVSGVAAVAGANQIGVTTLGGSLTPGVYNLITASGGLSGSFLFANGSTREIVSAGGSSYALTLANSSTAETVSVAQVPNAPTSLGVAAVRTGNAYQVNLQWPASNGANSYEIFRSTTSGGVVHAAGHDHRRKLPGHRGDGQHPVLLHGRGGQHRRRRLPSPEANATTVPSGTLYWDRQAIPTPWSWPPAPAWAARASGLRAAPAGSTRPPARTSPGTTATTPYSREVFGTVTISGPVSSGSIQFNVNGYVTNNAFGGSLALPSSGTAINVAVNCSATFNAAITGSGPFGVTGSGVLALSGTDTFSGAITVGTGSTLDVDGNLTAAGSVTVNGDLDNYGVLTANGSISDCYGLINEPSGELYVVGSCSLTVGNAQLINYGYLENDGTLVNTESGEFFNLAGGWLNNTSGGTISSGYGLGNYGNFTDAGNLEIDDVGYYGCGFLIGTTGTLTIQPGGTFTDASGTQATDEGTLTIDAGGAMDIAGTWVVSSNAGWTSTDR